MKEGFIVAYHHEVLPAWERCSVLLGKAPAVLSLDFHTDVLNCAARGVLPETVPEALDKLHHDEHFDWALRAGIISRAVIISLSPCAVQPEHPALEVRRSKDLPDLEAMLNSPEDFREMAGMVLDDRFLAPLLTDGFPHGEYILDIDCDVVMCEAALHPEQSSLIDTLASNAAMITFSREEEWIRILKLPGETIDGFSVSGELCRRWGVNIF
ncbi:MAG: UPF0489 family protein [Lentisphaeria bacterium]|nr:UPF0489 family protein [Lentisphaeria bacterium]